MTLCTYTQISSLSCILDGPSCGKPDLNQCQCRGEDTGLAPDLIFLTGIGRGECQPIHGRIYMYCSLYFLLSLFSSLLCWNICFGLCSCISLVDVKASYLFLNAEKLYSLGPLIFLSHWLMLKIDCWHFFSWPGHNGITRDIVQSWSSSF